MRSDILENMLFERLQNRAKTVATAESCTGGLIAHRITNVPGMSDHFPGGVVAYSNEAKRSLLGVPAVLLQQHGAVSQPVAEAMAEGARRRFGSDLGVGVTGIAGPGGGSPEKPVGLVYIAVADGRRTVCARNLFLGSREEIKAQTADKALTMLLESLE